MIWHEIEKNKFYQKLNQNKILGKLINREIISYVFFGVLTTVVSIGSYAIFLWIFKKNGWFTGNSQNMMALLAKHRWLKYVPNLSESLGVFAANLLSWVFAVAFAFITNKLFVFDSKSWKPAVASKELLSFTGSRVFSLIAETVVIVLMVSALSSNEVLAKLIGQVVVLILNYILSKVFVFKKAKL